MPKKTVPPTPTPEHQRAVEALANLIPLGFDCSRDGVSNVYEAAERILAAGFISREQALTEKADVFDEAYSEGVSDGRDYGVNDFHGWEYVQRSAENPHRTALAALAAERAERDADRG